jgi:hypothetical protein
LGVSDFDSEPECRSDIPEEIRRLLRNEIRRFAAGYVYFIVAGPFIKIGYSYKPAVRLEKLQSGCPYRMRLAATVPGFRSLERDYHLRFILLRSGDSMEWFHNAGELAEYVDHLERGGVPMWEPGGPDYQEQGDESERWSPE